MHPWGLSGPQFLWGYLAALVVGVAVTSGIRWAVRRPRPRTETGQLSAEEIGFLSGGPRHAVQVAITRLVESGELGLDDNGFLSGAGAGGTTGSRLGDLVLRELAATRKMSLVVVNLAGHPAVTDIGTGLVRRGLLVDPARARRARWFAPVVLYALFVVGVVRWINGIANDLPIGYLTYLLTATILLAAYLANPITGTVKARTTHGDRALDAALRDASEPLIRVAVSGPRAHPYTEVRRVLVAGAVAATAGGAWRYASGGGFDPLSGIRPTSSTAYQNDYTSPSGGTGAGCGGGAP
ncbi:TIGR04222 domain-containing membrane protein [Amycolatopsis thermoflava]|uniref:TIGR04222 domain-containing membrane protein n=1 Tax=Amycolatopsis thermoflava TaxID=84480 RepID=UPI00364BA929